MKEYLLNLINPNLMWAQTSAYGMSWHGYCRRDINKADSVKQILRVTAFSDNDYALEFWEINRMSTYTMHSSKIQIVTGDLIEIMEIIIGKRLSYVRIY